MKRYVVTKTLKVAVDAENEREAIIIGNDVFACEEYMLEGELEEHGITVTVKAKEQPKAQA